MLWHDGKIRNISEAILAANDRGLSLGDGIFETLPAFNGIAFLKQEHIARMKASAEYFSISFDQNKIQRAIDELSEANKEPSVIRITLTRGVGERGLAFPKEPKPEIFAIRNDWSDTLAFQKITLSTSSIRRNATSPSSSHKTLSYLDSVMAHADAQKNHADDALMLDQDGHIASTSMANLFALSGRELLTPQKGALLPGIIRDFIIGTAPKLGLTVIEKHLHVRDLLAADLVFSTNSVRLMTMITMIDDNTLKQKSTAHYLDLENALKDQILADTNYRI
ncbi:MAG: aminotransferase class IV [Hyphomicrobiales bacterium]